MKHDQQILAGKLLDRSSDRVPADAVLIGQLKLARQPVGQLASLDLGAQVVGYLLPEQAGGAHVNSVTLIRQGHVIIVNMA